jgi:hypothetical protein
MSRRVVKCTEQYNLVVEDFDSLPITFRVWKYQPIIEVKVDSNFAKANGFGSVSDMWKNGIGGREIVAELGREPKWLRVTEDGDFSLYRTPKELLN